MNDGLESSGEVREGEREREKERERKRERKRERESGCVNHRIRMTKMVFFLYP